jgi:hypothetical protein
VGPHVPESNEIGISRESLANALKTYQLSMDSNQRSYAWEKENVTELFQDLQAAIDGDEPEYFLGSIVVTRAAGHVVDGQQRLATTAILIAAMRDYCVENGETNRAEDLEKGFLFHRDFRTQQVVPHLSLGKRDHDFFVKRILTRPTDPGRLVQPDKNRDSHQRILAAAEIAKERVKQITEPYNPQQRAEKLADWLEYLLTRARVIWISVPDDANAYTIFETLNDRGADLSISDLLKVNLFNIADDRLTEAETRWDAMLGALEANGGEELAKTYMRHVWVAMQGPTRERELLSRIKAVLTSKQAAIDLATELAESAKYYSAILNPANSHWIDDTTKFLIDDLITLDVEQVRPLLLSIVKKFDVAEIKTSLRNLVSWTVRFLIHGGLGGGTLERHYSLRAKDIWDGRITTAKDLADNMMTILPQDVEFEASFSVQRVSKQRLIRFYLRALEKQVNGGDPCLVPNANKDTVNVEHVLPEHPGANWPNVRPEEAKAYFRRIGNLTLLSAPINSAIGNSGFSAKSPSLATSEFKLTSEIAQQHTIWGVLEINARQKRLAALALKTWPLR